MVQPCAPAGSGYQLVETGGSCGGAGKGLWFHRVPPHRQRLILPQARQRRVWSEEGCPGLTSLRRQAAEEALPASPEPRGRGGSSWKASPAGDADPPALAAPRRVALGQAPRAQLEHDPPGGPLWL